MHDTVSAFSRKHIRSEMVKDKRIIEIGAASVNGGVKSYCMKFEPESYTGLDICAGPDVDIVHDITTYETTVQYDGIICTEMLEHVYSWPLVVVALKKLLISGGWMILTTRSPGYPVHYHPHDFWRFTVEDMQVIFGTWVENIWTDLVIEKDDHNVGPGVMVYLTKKCDETLSRRINIFHEALNNRHIYSMVHGVKIKI